MTFHDLPPDWPSRSLRHPRLAADVVDLVVRESDRAAGCLCLLLCDDDGRMIQPVLINDLPETAQPGEQVEVLERFVGHLGASLAGIVVAIGRPPERHLDDVARGWHDSAISVCRAAGVELVGTYLATPDGVRQLPTWVSEQLAS